MTDRPRHVWIAFWLALFGLLAPVAIAIVFFIDLFGAWILLVLIFVLPMAWLIERFFKGDWWAPWVFAAIVAGSLIEAIGDTGLIPFYVTLYPFLAFLPPAILLFTPSSRAWFRKHRNASSTDAR